MEEFRSQTSGHPVFLGSLSWLSLSYSQGFQMRGSFRSYTSSEPNSAQVLLLEAGFTCRETLGRWGCHAFQLESQDPEILCFDYEM